MTALLDAVAYDAWALHLLIWLPVLGMLGVVTTSEDRAKDVAFWTSLLVFVLSLGLWWAYDPGAGGATFQLATSVPWIESFGIRYAVGVDGISLFMILLTTFTTPVAVLGSYRYIQKRKKAFYALMLLLETGVVGVFASLDLFLFYVFFELTLVPMYFIVGVWGGERRIYAAVKFFLYTAVGSLLMLVAILYLHWQARAMLGVPTFGYEDLLGLRLSLAEQLWLFGAFALAFSIKVPLFPLHTWLPDAHVEAPTPGSVVLAAVLLKMGTYGFVRFLLPLFPGAAQHPTVVTVMLVLAIVGIVYAAWVAAVQPDAKKLVAYTSVAHMGFVVLGVFALTVNGLQGGMIVMISHGVSTGALFLLLGMLYERRHTRLIEDFGGLGRVAPMFATAFVVTALASIGLPGLSGFVGEFLALLGAFQTHPYLTIVAATGVIFAAYYMLPMVQRVWYNELTPENRDVQDLSGRELVILTPMVLLMVWIGVYPTPFLERMEPSLQAVLERVEGPEVSPGVAELGERAELVLPDRRDAAPDRRVDRAGEMTVPGLDRVAPPSPSASPVAPGPEGVAGDTEEGADHGRPDPVAAPEEGVGTALPGTDPGEARPDPTDG